MATVITTHTVKITILKKDTNQPTNTCFNGQIIYTTRLSTSGHCYHDLHISTALTFLDITSHFLNVAMCSTHNIKIPILFSALCTVLIIFDIHDVSGVD
jgi:hypothetical protein